ncbi:hypothetical protein HCA58_00750 [Micromonospora sp. HNM0581]|nr:hypothetical protein [Micromonospora sp. HNM0581]NLU76944.1 hypothetical protein [Micromonospora sp. HNM0581]
MIRDIPLKVELTLHDGRTAALQELYGSELLAWHSRDKLPRVFERITEG